MTRLVIQGAGGSSAFTTITTASDPHGIYIYESSHVMFQHLTMRQNPETMVQGTYSSHGTVAIPAGTSSDTFATLTVDILPPATEVPIQSQTNHLAIANAGSGYTESSFPVVLPTTGAICTQAETLTVNISGGSISLVSVLQPAVCTKYPNPGSDPIPLSDGTNSSGSIYLSYIPTPMSEWINSYNHFYSRHVFGQSTSYVKAYTNAPSPKSIESTTTPTNVHGNIVQNLYEWGNPRVGSTRVLTPPTLSTSPSTPHRWTITFSQPLSEAPTPSYFLTKANFVCFHNGFGSAFYVEDRITSGSTTLNGGTDIVFNDMSWVNVGRGEFHGVTGAQVLNSALARDPTTYPHAADGSIQYPCYSSQGGGLQFSQPSEPATYGNLVSNFTAESSADDSAAFFNDVGGTGGFPQSSIVSSTITNADDHPIRLNNNSAITGLANSSATATLDSGQCPSSMPVGTTGSPVCVDGATTSVITGTPQNCDTNFWDQVSTGSLADGSITGCPIFRDYNGFSPSQT